MLNIQEEDKEESHQPISSSSRRESYLSENGRRSHSRRRNNAKAIGCMAGVFRLLSKYQTRGRRTFLISGKNEGKNNADAPSSSSGKAPKSNATKQPSPPEIITATGDQKNEEGRDKTCRLRRFSCKGSRSPTLPAEIRRSNSLNSPESFGGSTPALVARLMASEEIPPAEKRRKLLGALEKCEEDLRAIKKMIEAHLSAAEGLPPPPRAMNDSKEHNGVSGSNRHCGGADTLKKVKKASPTTVSVLDLDHYHGQMVLQQKQQKPKPRKNPREEDNIVSACLLHRATTTTTTAVVESSPLWGNKGKRESVEEVCRDIAWGEKREVGRIGFVLQDYICKDLIEEVVKELLGASTNCCIYSLPLEACKRRLPF